MSKRRIFVGDVQGCGDELDALLGRVGLSKGDELYFVGDLISRGTKADRVLELVQQHKGTCVLGNHEYWLLRRGFFEEKALDPGDWPQLRELATHPDRVRYGKWIRKWPIMVDLGDIWLVHAAVPPKLWKSRKTLPDWTSLRYDDKREFDDEQLFALHARYCDAKGRRPKKDWPEPGGAFAPWDEHYKGDAMVVFGHWARRGLVRKKRVRGLDTGCVYGGKLTAWIAEKDQLVQVPARRSYWPR